MSPDNRAALVYQFTVAPRDATPLVRGWNRLEGRPRSADFQRSLRAEVRDPIWFLSRQWQYGEFEGEDAGSPIDVRMACETTELSAYEIDNRLLAPYDASMPLEVRVEREPVPFDLMLHMQLARVFERLLDAKGHAARLADYAALYPLDYDTGIAGAHTDEARGLFEMARPFLFDTQRLIAAVRDGSQQTAIAGFHGLTPAEKIDLMNAAGALVLWFDNEYALPTPEQPAWQRERLEYRFACWGRGGNLRLAADAHRGGDLDWHAFDLTRDLPPGAVTPVTALSFLPTSIGFDGMPSPRFWEIEDGLVDFGRLDVESNDVAKLLTAEFLLLYTNDWCVLPLELAIGSFTRIHGLLVTDVFGDQTLVRPADLNDGGARPAFSMFRLAGDTADVKGVFLAPTLTSTMEAAPMERVEFLRDEMANMVWAIEQRVPSKLGEPWSPDAVAPAVPASEVAAGATARYTLGTTVPANWRPFVPAHLPGSTRSVRLQRARMPGQPLEPIGEILKGPAPYFIAEEEVPRAGRTVTRAFQRARWTNGTTFLWIGRSSPTGRGEGSSGLVFDRVDEVPPA